MEASLKRMFMQKGVFDAAPDFEDDFVFYDRSRSWRGINCLGWALGYKGKDFSERNRKMTSRLYHREEMCSGLAYLLSHTSIVPIADDNLFNIPEGHYPIVGFMPSVFHGYDLYSERQEDAFVDYHWYRMDNKGPWSHKDGWKSIAKDTDASEEEIRNPLEANRYSQRDGYIYSRLIGFFAVQKNGAQLFTSPQDNFSAIERHIRHSLQRQKVPRVA